MPTLRVLPLLVLAGLLLLGACDRLTGQRSSPTPQAPEAHPSLFAAGYRGGIYQSSNGGETWTPLLPDAGDLSHYFKVLALSQGPSPTLYVGTTGQGLYRVPLGEEPSPVALPGLKDANVKDILLDPTDSNRVYVATWGRGVMLSRDRGETWRAWNEGLTYAFVRALTVAPTTPLTVYAGTVGGVFARRADGPVWEARSTGLGVLNVKALAIGPGDPRMLYAGTAPHKNLTSLYRSDEEGGSWQALEAGLTGVTVFAILPDPLEPRTVLVGTSDGVRVTHDGGRRWKDWSDGLPEAPVYSLLLTPQPSRAVFAATHGGVYRRREGEGRWLALRYGLEGEMITALALTSEKPTPRSTANVAP